MAVLLDAVVSGLVFLVLDLFAKASKHVIVARLVKQDASAEAFPILSLDQSLESRVLASPGLSRFSKDFLA